VNKDISDSLEIS